RFRCLHTLPFTVRRTCSSIWRNAMQYLRQAILTTAITIMLAGTASADTGAPGSSDAPQDGSRVTRQRDPFTDGAHNGRFDPFTDGKRSPSFGDVYAGGQ